MKRWMVCVLALGVSAACVAESFSDSMRQVFLEACVEGGGTAAECVCVLKQLESRYALSDVASGAVGPDERDDWVSLCSAGTREAPVGNTATESEAAPEGSSEPLASVGLVLDPGQRPASFDTVQRYFLGWVQTKGLPAVSSDGTRVVVAAVDPDGVRGYPNLRVVELEVGGDVLRTTWILSVDEVKDFGPKTALAVEERVETANAALRAEGWSPLSRLEKGAEGFALPGGMELRYQEPVLRVVDEEGVALVETTYEGWRAPEPGKDCEALGTCDCDFPGFARSAWRDERAGVVVIEIGFVGDGICVEPQGRFHAIRVPQTTGRRGL